ncbi:MAG: hypothetical protein IK095_03180 [Oscillospiraceae bacterium]|nr:hypothetical protein [Oscillospiraceae bacterium]
MKLFKNPVVAWIVCLALIFGSTLLNTRIRFGRLCRDAEADFNGLGGIVSQLQTIRSDADILALVAEDNGLETDALRDASDALQRALAREQGAKSVFSAYDVLHTEIARTQQKLMGVSLSSSDAQTVSSCMASLDDAQRAIAASGYNETVREFQRRYDRFPTKYLAEFAGVRMPEVFG